MPLKKRLDPRFKRGGDGTLKNTIKMSKGGYLAGIGNGMREKTESCMNCKKKLSGGLGIYSRKLKKMIYFCNKLCRKEFEND